MSSRWPGGLISKTAPTPANSYNTTKANGVWTLDQAAYLQSQNLWPNPNSDAYFNYNTLLLNGDGTNGAQNNTFLDSSTNNFTITRNGNTTQGSFSPYGNLWSNYFNGASNINFPNSSDWVLNADFTMEGWFYLNSGGANQLVMAQSNAIGQANWYQYINTSNQFVGQWINSSTVFSVTSSTLTLNAWTHFAITLSGTTLTLYINGVSQGTTTVSGSANSANPYELRIGGFSTSFYQLNGYISNIRYVKGTVVYTTNFTPSTTPLTAITNTKLLTCQSNRFVDNSTNNATASTAGTPSVQRFSPFNPTAPYSTSVIGGSIYTDGTTNQALTVAGTSALGLGTGDFTEEAWVYPLSTSSEPLIFDWRPAAADYVCPLLGVRTGSNDIILYVNGSIVIQASFSNQVGQWIHVAVSRVSGQTRLFINGVQGGSTYSDSNNYITPSTLIIDGQINGSNKCYMCDARLIKGTGLYTTTFTPPTAPLTAVTNTVLLLNAVNAGIPDLAMQNNLETVGSAQVSTSVKKYGTGSLKFNGTTDYFASSATLPAYLGTGNWTIETWVYLNTLSPANYEVIANYGYEFANQTYQSWLLYINTDNTLRFAYQTGSGNTDTSFGNPGFSANTWAHLAVVRNGSTITAYVNGTALGTTINIGTNNIIYRASPSQFTLGWSGASSFFNGYLDDFRITKGLARYTANFTPPTSALPTY
jgi:hypothetical protein